MGHFIKVILVFLLFIGFVRAQIPPIPDHQEPTPAPLPRCIEPILPDFPRPTHLYTPGGSGLPQPTPTIEAPAAALKNTTTPCAAIGQFEAFWNNGLFFRTADGAFSSHIGGTIHYDGAWYTGGQSVQFFPGGVGRFSDGVHARRVRLFMEGTFYKDFDYKFEIEFMNGFSPLGLAAPITPTTVSNSPGPTDAWITLKNVPLVGNIRIGNQKEWFSLEHLEDYRSLMYMERSYLFELSQSMRFNNGFSPGISVFSTWMEDRIFSGLGVYKNENDLFGFGVADGNYAITGRLAGLIMYLPEDCAYWHVGGAFSHRDPVAGQVQITVRNSVRNAPVPLLNLIANTGPITSSSQNLFNLETAAAYGPFTFSAEYTTNLINDARVGGGPNLGTVFYEGCYLQCMYFLTGEHRDWDPKLGVFKRVIPKRNFSWREGGIGAVEVGGRYTFLNLDDKGVNGGKLHNLTLGTTWYWNPNARLQVNYDYMYRDGGTNPIAQGAIHSLGVRMAMDF